MCLSLWLKENHSSRLLLQGSTSVLSLCLWFCFPSVSFKCGELTLTEREIPVALEVTAVVDVPLKSRLDRKEGPRALGFAEEILVKSVRKI